MSRPPGHDRQRLRGPPATHHVPGVAASWLVRVPPGARGSPPLSTTARARKPLIWYVYCRGRRTGNSAQRRRPDPGSRM